MDFKLLFTTELWMLPTRNLDSSENWEKISTLGSLEHWWKFTRYLCIPFVQKSSGPEYTGTMVIQECWNLRLYSLYQQCRSLLKQSIVKKQTNSKIWKLCLNSFSRYITSWNDNLINVLKINGKCKFILYLKYIYNVSATWENKYNRDKTSVNVFRI